MTTFRDALVPKFISGEVRVTNAPAAISEAL